MARLTLRFLDQVLVCFTQEMLRPTLGLIEIVSTIVCFNIYSNYSVKLLKLFRIFTSQKTLFILGWTRVHVSQNRVDRVARQLTTLLSLKKSPLSWCYACFIIVVDFRSSYLFVCFIIVVDIIFVYFKESHPF